MPNANVKIIDATGRPVSDPVDLQPRLDEKREDLEARLALNEAQAAETLAGFGPDPKRASVAKAKAADDKAAAPKAK